MTRTARCAAFVLTIATSVLIASGVAAATTFQVTSVADQGEGTLRQAILAANAEAGSKIEFALAPDQQVVVESALPALRASAILVEGRGATMRSSADCERPGGKKGCDALVVEGPDIVVRDLRIAGFVFDAVSVRGGRARNVRVERIHAINNGDDGVGVSYNAGPVLVTDCVLMGNGFRTKGKGLLVFSKAEATLERSVVVGNRDGITVTRGSKARLDQVLVAGNYDKGVGVSGAGLVATGVAIVGNGLESETGQAAPNGDGLRVGLGGSADISDCLIAGNGDTGIVVLDTSRVRARDCRVDGNRHRATAVADTASLDLR